MLLNSDDDLPIKYSWTIFALNFGEYFDIEKVPHNHWILCPTIMGHFIDAMNANGVKRVISSNILGIYNEVPGEFGRWNHGQVQWSLKAAINADKLLKDSGLDYTTIRIPWLNDHDKIKYTVTHEGEQYNGVSGSRKSVADVIVKMIADPTYLANDSIGLADPATQGLDRPVY